MYIARASEMQEVDRYAIEEYAIPGIVLMENAGRGTADFMARELGSLTARTIPILVGPGNNGGDGLVIARHLHQLGAHPLVLFGLAPERLKNDAAINRDIVQRMGLDAMVLDEHFSLSATEKEIIGRHGRYPVACLVDALFGTGLARKIEGHFARIIELINHLRESRGWPIVSVDLPSGINSDTGMVLGTSVRADLTATYGLAKPAHYLHNGSGVGRLEIIDITIPARIPELLGLKGRAITRSSAPPPPARQPDAHKGTNGHLLVLAGSEGKTGAAILSCRAALRAGCGLVSAVVPNDLYAIFEASLIETMTVPLPESTGSLSIDDLDSIIAAVRGKQALLIGPGIGTDKATRELLLFLYREVDLPMVVDADGLNILARHPEVIGEPGGPRLLTPHPGEMARLLRTQNRAVQEDRIGAALRLVEGMDAEMVVALKGAGTVVADNRGNWAVNTSGNSGMAAAGMGDVLAGLCGSLLAQGVSVWESATLAVHIHGLAADLLARKHPYGFTALEVADMLPAAFAEKQQVSMSPKLKKQTPG